MGKTPTQKGSPRLPLPLVLLASSQIPLQPTIQQRHIPPQHTATPCPYARTSYLPMSLYIPLAHVHISCFYDPPLPLLRRGNLPKVYPCSATAT